MPPVPVIPVNPVGRDLEALATHADRHSPVLEACVNGPVEEALHRLRLGRSRDVPVVGRLPEQRIPHAAADGVGLVACVFQYRYDFFHLSRKFDRHRLLPEKSGKAAGCAGRLAAE